MISFYFVLLGSGGSGSHVTENCCCCVFVSAGAPLFSKLGANLPIPAGRITQKYCCNGKIKRNSRKGEQRLGTKKVQPFVLFGAFSMLKTFSKPIVLTGQKIHANTSYLILKTKKCSTRWGHCLPR